MSKIVNRVCAGLFLDSVILMQISRSITRLDGVEDAALMIGTPSNLDLLDNAKLLAGASRKATGGDLILAIRARDEALRQVHWPRPRSCWNGLRLAIRGLPLCVPEHCARHRTICPLQTLP